VWIASLVGTLDFVSTRIGWGDDHRSRFPFCAGSPVGIHGRSLGRSDLLGAQGPCKTQTSTELIVCGDPYAEARISQHLFGLNNFSAWTTFVPNNFSVSTTFGPQYPFGLNNFSAWTTFRPGQLSVSTTFGLNNFRSQQRSVSTALRVSPIFRVSSTFRVSPTFRPQPSFGLLY
jgi:hypothetical protein